MFDWILAIAAMALVGWIYHARQRRGAALAVADVAAEARLERAAGEATWRAGPIQVGIERVAVGHDVGLAVTLTPDEGQRRVSLGRNGALKKPLRGADVVTGDAAFDGRVRVAGDALPILAALDERARAAVREAVGAGWWVEDGAWKTTFAPSLDAATIGDELRRALAWATTFAVRDDPAALLAARAFSGVSADERLAIVRALAAYAPEHPATRDALKGAVWGAEREADALGVLALVREPDELGAIAASGRSRPAVRGAALERLAAEHPQHRATAATVQLFQSGGVLDPWRARALARALERVPHDDREGALLGLARYAEDVVVAAAAEVLGRVGTLARAVPVLAVVRDARDGPLGALVAGAIVRIQERAGASASDAGGLALAEDAGGALSLAEDGEAR